MSDARQALAMMLDGRGLVTERLELPPGRGSPQRRGVTVRLGDSGRLAPTGTLDGPGTHAEVRTKGFSELVSIDERVRP